MTENKEIQEVLPKITPEMREKLRADFPKEAYSQHPTKTFLTTLKAMYITERLNNVFGVGRWTINIEIIKELDSYVLVQGEFVSLDYEVITPKQFGGHTIGGKNTELADSYKSAITDCQSKIASYLEIGIDMFKGKIKGSGAKSDYQPKPQPASSKPQETVSQKSNIELLTDEIDKRAAKKFKSKEEYKIWRIDNSLRENLDGAMESELKQISMKLYAVPDKG